MLTAIRDVAEFHDACDVPTADVPGFPGIDRILLRRSLMEEEFDELSEAINHRDIVEVAKEMADLIYVVIGTALEFGIPLADVWDAVHDSNIAKVDPETGKVNRREDGKILKPEGWQKPDITAIVLF